ncbi:class I SAM-dependent DNA methyltransferase [Roseimicrobium sp. ORNL1]|uniref:class I SAM-dependent DNA methyltransferase n=1 Tax=Roseimicrobium sp. ORNL1 TaxID=2711231 RepID=UPI00197F5D22|nr:class I SAM-dependent DNA methyltransferase [Roseimicrobium sp. ORNL1]
MLPEVFIKHWAKAEANERANSQAFLIGLTQLLGVPSPSNSHADGYSFEYPVKVPGTSNTNYIDLYKRSHFVLESKQYTAKKEEQSMLQLAALKAGVVEEKKKSGPLRGTGAWDDAMVRAKGQAERYVRSLPAEEPNPPFLLVCDVGHTIEVYADFTQNGKAYLPFPDPRTFRIKLKDLANDKIRERLHLIWTNPTSLDPSKVSADVTREIAGYLAELAKSLEQAGHEPEVVAQFLTRCLFCMFAEDVGLLPEGSFTELLASVPGDGTGFEDLLGTLFREMNHGTGKSISVVLRKKLLRFNGGLFADHTVLPVNGMQLGLLKQAAKTNWRNVEPAIFGTLLERALVPEERHALGAHFTPRAYVERLVLPTVMEPLREEWESIRVAAITLANKDDMKGARKLVNAFHDKLCEVTVLDPACGSGNFLYVALEHMKRLEGEVIDLATDLGVDQRLDLTTHTVDPHQFLGIELNPRAAAIAELVLWIGYLQWHFRTRGQTLPEEPVLKTFKNIECRDAVLEYDGEPEPARDEHGHIRTVWDRRSYKTDLVTNRDVPDESKRVPLLTYKNPRPAKWPNANFIVGNPPFLGKVKLREDLGDGYAETLRAAYPPVPESADFVLYWWHKAATLVRTAKARRFGLITTNSLRQTFARRVVQMHLDAELPLSLAFAVPDHPWVDTVDGAAVRIAMSVGVAGSSPGSLLSVIDEVPQPDGSSIVTFEGRRGQIKADLSVGANVSAAIPLKANALLASTGLILGGRGFVITSGEAKELKRDCPSASKLVFPLKNGDDINGLDRNAYVIDTNG